MQAELPAKEFLPKHIGFIMDGNGRWATNQGLARSEGHKAGAKVFRKIVEYAVDIGIEYLTFYAFSTENWSRPENEVSALMSLFREYLFEAEEKKLENERRGVRLKFIGDMNALPSDISGLMLRAERESIDKHRAVVNLAINYGGRQEILKSVKELAENVARGKILPCDITEESIAKGLYTSGQPDPDLIIRPSGELRLSNFLVWQSAYSEFWFSDVLWPDFTPAELDKALFEYARRNRRFGGI